MAVGPVQVAYMAVGPVQVASMAVGTNFELMGVAENTMWHCCQI